MQEDLLSKVEEAIKEGEGYNSLADFISDSVRRRLEEIEKIKLVGDELELSEEDVKHMAKLEHTNVAVNGNKTVIAVTDHTDGRI